MKYPGFIGGAYTLRSKSLDAQRCVNLYLIADEKGTGKDGNAGMLVSVPGKRLALNAGNDGVIRGLYTASNGEGFLVCFNKIYKLNSDKTTTDIGTIVTQSGLVSMADNGVQLMIVDGSYGYIYTFASGVFAQVTDPDMPQATQVRFLDGYFILNQANTGRFFITSLYDGFTIDTLDFATAEGSPDNIVALETLRKQLWIFGTQSVQVYFNSGDLDFPFAPINGVFIETGLASTFSVVKVDQTIFWLGSNKDGQGVVYMANGYQPQRISTNAIEFAIASYGDLSSVTAFGYQQEGATFIQFNFSATSWVYDLNSREWHERCAFSNGEFSRDKANTHMFFNGQHLVGDYASSKIYQYDLDYHYDGSDQRKWLRSAPHIASGLNYIFYSRFEVDMEFGVGNAIAPGDDPQIIMRMSDDGANTWSNERYKSMGKIGQFNARAKFNNCGMSRDRVFEVSGTEPVKTVLLGASLELKVGSK